MVSVCTRTIPFEKLSSPTSDTRNVGCTVKVVVDRGIDNEDIRVFGQADHTEATTHNKAEQVLKDKSSEDQRHARTSRSLISCT